MTTEELFKRIKNEIYFFQIPLFAIYTKDDIKTHTHSLPILNGEIDETRLTDLRIVGRTILDVARLAVEGIPIYTSNESEAIKLSAMLEEYLLRRKHVVKLANAEHMPQSDIDAINFLADSILVRHQDRIYEEEKKEDDKIKSIFTPGGIRHYKVK